MAGIIAKKILEQQLKSKSGSIQTGFLTVLIFGVF
jgi:hypothetical protein